MRAPGIAVILGIVFITANVAHAKKVTTEFDHNINFDKYKTFMWIHEPERQEGVMKNLILQWVNEQLTNKGLSEVSADAGLFVSVDAPTVEKPTGVSYRRGGGPNRNRDESLRVDLFDARTGDLVWQGVSTVTCPRRPDKAALNEKKQIEKMFRDYAPGFAEEVREGHVRDLTFASFGK